MKRCLCLLLLLALLCSCAPAQDTGEPPLADGFIRLRLYNNTDSAIHGFGYEFRAGGVLLQSGQCNVIDGGWLAPGEALSEDISEDVLSGHGRCTLKIYIIGSDHAKYCENVLELNPADGPVVVLLLFAEGSGYRVVRR